MLYTVVNLCGTPNQINLVECISSVKRKNELSTFLVVKLAEVKLFHLPNKQKSDTRVVRVFQLFKQEKVTTKYHAIKIF